MKTKDSIGYLVTPHTQAKLEIKKKKKTRTKTIKSTILTY